MNHYSLNYDVIDHTADLGIIVRGADERDLFINAAYAMIDLMVVGKIGRKERKKKLTVQGEDFADLMVRWLGEILYLFDAEKQLVCDIEITAIGPNRLQSLLNLTRFRQGRHQIRREIKAVTYHQISVEETPDGWKARVIFDI